MRVYKPPLPPPRMSAPASLLEGALLPNLSRPCFYCCSVAKLFLTLLRPRQAPQVHGIFQAKILEWVAISSSRRSSWAREQEVTNPHPVSSALAGRFFTTEPPGKSLLLLLMARYCFSGFPVMLDSTFWADAGFPQHLFWWNTSTTQFPF